MLKAKRSHVDIELIPFLAEEYPSHRQVKISNLHGAGVDDIISLLAHALKPCSLLFDYRLCNLSTCERMVSSRLVKSPNQRWRRCIYEEYLALYLLAAL